MISNTIKLPGKITIDQIDGINSELVTDYSKMYLTFEVLELGDLYFRGYSEYTFYYSTDNGKTWSESRTGLYNFIGTFSAGTKILFKGNNSIYGSDPDFCSFNGSAKVKVSGNIMSLVYGDDFLGFTSLTSSAFYCLFYNYAGIIDASNLVLPSTILADYCYSGMFQGCTGLIKAPKLPATTLAPYCYAGMFYGCTSLINAPELPATTLAQYCYFNMFRGCTMLTAAPELPAITLTQNCYSNIFYGCSNLHYIKALFTTTPSNTYTQSWVVNVAESGTFVKSNSATWDVTGSNGIPSGWNTYTESGYEPLRKGDNIEGGGSGIPYLYIAENSGEVSIDYGDTTYETYEDLLDLCTILQGINTDLCAIYFRNRIILGPVTVSYNDTVKSIIIQSAEGDNFSVSSDTPSNPDPGDSLVTTVTNLVASNAELEDALGDIDSVLDEILGDVDAALDTVLGEDATPMQEKIVIEIVSGNVLSAYPGKYYKFSAAVETLDITLNHSFNSNTIETIVFNMTGGTTPNVMFDSATGEVIYYSDGFNIESGKTYEVSALWNGSNWLIANINLSAQTS